MSRLTWANGNETRRLSIQTANEEAHEHTVTTRPDFWDRQTSQPAGVAYRKLTSDIGYVDLGLLPVDQIEAMVQRLRETRGLIVDLRHGTQTLAAVSRLAKRTTIVERDRRPTVSLQEESDPQAQPTGGFLESTVTLEKPLEPYEGIVVGLIDEYCQSQLEHGAMGLKVAADAVLIGSATAGARWYANKFALP